MSDASSVIDVAAGVILRDGHYLITRRMEASPQGGLWEFPGGKTRPGESLKDCLRRELREELDITVEVGEEVQVSCHAYREYTVRLHFYQCTIRGGTPRPLASQEYRWVPLRELKEYAFPEANRDFVERLGNYP